MRQATYSRRSKPTRRSLISPQTPTECCSAVLVSAGVEVEIGAPIALVGLAGEETADVDAALASLSIASPPAMASSASSGGAARCRDCCSTATTGTGDAHRRTATSCRVYEWLPDLHEPSPRRLVKDAGIAIELITGTGPNGRIIRRDVEAAIATQLSGQTATPRLSAATAAMPSRATAKLHGECEFTDVPHSRARRAIAQHLTESKQTIPHYYLRGSAQVDELLAIRAGLNETSPVKISVNDFIIKVGSAAHQLVPAMNVMWTGDYVRKMSTVDIGAAVATPAGLVSPVLRGVEEMPLSLVATTTRDFVERAREGRLHQQELEGGVSTVTNLGMYGTEEFAAIINPPQSSILAVGAVRKEPVVTNKGKVKARSVIHVILSIDHRPIDGAIAAQWMQAFLNVLEHPMHLLG